MHRHREIPTNGSKGYCHNFMKYFTWRNLFIVLALFGLLWYIFNHQMETRVAIEHLIEQLF